ncbi:DBF4-type zinc finger-containing protein 2 isoform X1 [Heterocephalus glaber]|uniref:DBF4-type zinc finger-containing protein 2 isoform X1 n=2 Tax=Heterocephalus glaber TaxID=10181 RepID=A0AAX6QYX5_HETGA|nr:DBF4-type zinc finger-containing protein 2 isoform X1 [Heterocephalus glaber]
MQKRQGYCSYCRVTYANLEQHLFSAQHRTVTRQSRQRLINNNSLMERFLQDVLQHHPCNYQDNRLAPCEMPTNTTAPEVIRLDEIFPDNTEAEEINSKRSESVEELSALPGVSQNSTKEVSVRPSVIQKLEKGQQQSLEFNKIESCVRKINPVGVGQATNSGKSVIRLPVICNARCLPESSHARPVVVSTSRAPLAASSALVSKFNPSKDDRYVKELDEAPRNHMPSCHLETSSGSYENPKESNGKSVCVNLDKLLYQKDAECQGETLSPIYKFHEPKDTKSSVGVESSSSIAVNSVVKLNKPDVSSAQWISVGAIPKHHGEFLSREDCTQEEKHLVCNKPGVLKQKCSVSATVKLDRGSLQSVSVPARKAVQELHLWKEEQGDHEDENCGSRGSEMSFKYDSFSHSPTDLSEVTARKINLSGEIHAPLQYKSNEISSEKCDDSLQVVDNQPQVINKEKNPQKVTCISLVDESYDSSGSEMNFDCDNSAEPTDNDPQQADIDVVFPAGVPIDLVDRSYGSDSSKGRAASVASIELVVEEPPVNVTKKKLHRRPRICLVDKSCKYGYSESSSDSEGFPQSADDHPRMTVTEGNQKGRPVQLKNKKYKPSSAKAHLACGVSLEAVNQPQGDVEGIKLLKKKDAGLVHMNCESHAPEMGFHANAELVANESQVAVKELNLQAVDTDLDNKSVQSSISDLSFESNDCLYQSANDDLEGDLGEVNLTEVNVDVEAQSSGCSSSELTFDSDSPLLSVTERSQLDVERLKEDPFNLEEESCESDSSGITFDSDIATFSVADQPQVAVYEEEPVDLENESDESCVSDITFDSDIPLHSGNEQAEVAVKEVIIQEEEYVPLEKKNANPSGSEISLDSYAPLHSVTNPPEVAVRKLNSQKEQQVHLKHKENKPTDSELNLSCDTFHSTTGHSEDLVNDRNFQKEEHVQLENKHHKFSVSGTRPDSDIPLLSVIHKPQVVVKNIWLHKEKQAGFQGRSADFSASEVKSNVLHCPVTEPQVSLKRKEKKKHIEKKTDKYGDSELILNSDDLPQSVRKKPRLAVLQEDLVHPEGEGTQCRGFEAHLDVTGSLCSVSDQPHLILWNEKLVNLKDRSKLSDSKISFHSVEHLQSLAEQHHKVIKKKTIILKSKIDEPGCSKAIHNSEVLKSAADQPEVAVKWISQGKEYRIFLENKSKNIYFETNLDSDFLVQAIVDRPNIAAAKSEAEGKCDPSGDSEGNSDSAASVQPVADQLREMAKETAPRKNEDVDIEGKRAEAEGFEIIHDSDVRQPVTGQTKVIQEVKLLKKRLGLEDKNVKPSGSKMNFYSNEPPQSVTNEEPIKEANLPVKGHVCFDDKGYQSDNSDIIYISNIPFRSVIQQPQSLQEKCASLEMKSSDPHPTTSFDSNEPCQSMPGQLQKTVQEMNPKEGHIYPEDKSCNVVGFEGSYDSDVPVQFVVDPSHASVKEINVQEEDHNDLENESYKACCSETKCGSGIHLQSEVDPPQVAWKETSFQNKELFDVEGQVSEPSDSEMYDSHVSFQIILTQSQSDGEADSPEVVVVNVVPGDCDGEGISDPEIPLQLGTDPPQLSIEGISDSEIPLQLVTDPPQLTIEETSCVNAESVDVGKSYCDFCGSELRYEASSQSETNQFKKTFKIINRNNDYIILGDSTCQSCSCEVDFNVDASGQSVTHQSQGPGQESFYSEDKSYESDGPEGNFYFEGTSQKTDAEVSLWKDPEYTRLNDNSWDSSGSAMDSAASSKSVIHHTADRENLLKLKHADLACKSGTSYGSQIDFQCDPSIQADAQQPLEVKKTRPRKRVTFDLREYHYFPSNSVSVVDSVKNLDEEPEVVEDSDEPVLETLPLASPSVSGETQPQKMIGDNTKTNCLVKKFKKDHVHCYCHNNCTTRKASLNEETEPTWPDSNQNIVSVQTLPDSDHVAGGSADTSDISVILEKTCCHCPLAVELLKQNWHLASQSQASKVNHATQTNKYSLKKRKITGQEGSPKRKCVQNDRKGKKQAQVVTVEVPTTSAEVLEPGQPSTPVCVSSADAKRKEGRSSRSSKRKQGSCDSQLQFMGKGKQNNLNEPLPKKTVINPPQNPVVAGSDTSESVDVHHNESDGNSSGARSCAPTQNIAPKSFITTARYKLRSRCGSNESCVFLESIDNVITGEAPKDSDFQPTPSNRNDAKVSPQSVKNKCFESKSKKKVSIRKATTSIKPRFPQSIFKAVIRQQNTRITSEKQSIWIQTKANAIIRKYTLKYSVFLRHRYQSRATFFAVNPKKKIPDGIRLKKGREPGKMLLNSSVPPAHFQERFRAIAGPSQKQLALRSSSTVGRNELDDKTYTYKKKTPTLVKAYNLRSSRYVPTGDRMTTRLSSKQSY